MQLSFITLFPEIIDSYLNTSVLGRARLKGLFEYKCFNPIDDAALPHRHVDDHPYGGGKGMVLRVDVLSRTLARALDVPTVTNRDDYADNTAVIVPSPSGVLFCQKNAAELAVIEKLIFICGRYEGIDQRFIDSYATHIYSLGKFVVSGGELPAMCMADAMLRVIPGVLSDGSKEIESFTDGDNIEYPQYTRPVEFLGRSVPEVLLSGNHELIAKWRKENSS